VKEGGGPYRIYDIRKNRYMSKSTDIKGNIKRRRNIRRRRSIDTRGSTDTRKSIDTGRRIEDNKQGQRMEDKG
jgi:hypothetical protein